MRVTLYFLIGNNCMKRRIECHTYCTDHRLPTCILEFYKGYCHSLLRGQFVEYLSISAFTGHSLFPISYFLLLRLPLYSLLNTMAALSAGFDLCALPSLEAPEGERSNLVDPYSLAPTMIAVSAVATAWALLFVAIRVWANWRKLNIADYLIIFGIIWDVAFTCMILSQSHFSRHQWNIPACWYDGQYMRIIFLITALSGFVSLCKAAILLMYLQLFSVSRGMRIAVWIGLVFDFLLFIPSVPMAAIYEAPRPGHSWEEMITANERNQVDILVPYAIATGAVSVLLDLYIFILPLPIIIKLHLSLSKKIQVALVFMTALLGVAASVISLVYRTRLADSKDTSWQQACFYIAMIVENNVAIIVSCIPSFAKAMKRDVFKSSQFTNLLSYLRHGKSSSEHEESSSVLNSIKSKVVPQSVLHKFGVSHNHAQPYERYYELNESALGRSQFTV
ncbi:hypothetical protein GGS26DRAFT_524281 [Hypomontagnella submonticulosa]|nr:hypothetical protein GGS26DRAFT_524281 [Hypomontagnella submonticulosa]